MPEDMKIPITMAQRYENNAEEASKNLPKDPKDKRWYSREFNEKMQKEEAWAAPMDPRFTQIHNSRYCFSYFVDYFRCKNLLGEDYKPCQYFQNVYKDVCPLFWVEKWHEWVEEGRFPSRFDR